MIGRVFMAIWFGALPVPLDWLLVEAAEKHQSTGSVIMLGFIGVTLTVGLVWFASWFLFYD
jgi:hypothetical protein